MAYGFEYFSGFDAFSQGPVAILLLVIFIYIFTYLGLRSGEKAVEKTGLITLASFVVLFLFSLFGLPSIVTGLAGVIAWSLAQKHYTKQEAKKWVPDFIVLWLMLWLFALVGDYMRWWLVFFGLAYNYIWSELIIRDEKKKKGEKGKSETE